MGKPGGMEVGLAMTVLFAAMLFGAEAALLSSIAGILALALYRLQTPETSAATDAKQKKNTLNQARKTKREARVAKVLAEIQRQGSMTNDQVQALAGVSDATAERYLEELEKAGKIVQVGESGQAVSYKAL